MTDGGRENGEGGRLPIRSYKFNRKAYALFASIIPLALITSLEGNDYNLPLFTCLLYFINKVPLERRKVWITRICLMTPTLDHCDPWSLRPLSDH